MLLVVAFATIYAIFTFAKCTLGIKYIAMKNTPPKSSTKDAFSMPKTLLRPRHWGSWLVAGGLYLLVKTLPYGWLMALGARLGKLMEKIMPYRFLVAKTNIRLCFAAGDWQAIYRKHVRAVGKGVFEMAMGWFLPVDYFADRVRHEGYEDVDKALQEGRGVLFLGLHTTGLDFGVPLINHRYPVHFMYRPAKNAVLDYIIQRGRLRSCPGAIDHRNLREIFALLKQGQCVWYGCDQDFGDNAKAVFAPFFGVSAYTLAYYAKIAQKTAAAVIPVGGFRDDSSGQFVVRYLPEIDLSSPAEYQAAEVMNHNIEKLLHGYEEQYYWVHRRFKTRPEGEEALYPPKPSHVRKQKKAIKKSRLKEQKPQ